MSIHQQDLDAYIQHKLASGEFGSRDEFFLEAARVYRELEHREQEIRRAVKLGLDEADAGFVLPLDIEAIKRSLAARIDESGRPINR
jgi:hypothetical protein